MPLPTYDELLLPLLRLAGQDGGEHPIRDLREQLAQQLALTPEEIALKLPSGRQAVFDNRVGWACTHLRKAQLVESPRRGYIQISPRGREVLLENPLAINDIYLQRFEEYRQFKERTTPDEHDRQNTVETAGTQQPTPDEMMRDAYAILEANLRDDLLDKIKQMDPGAFEWLVLRLLHAMGYGGSIKDVQGVPTGPDGGIDGLIKEDKLGLDAIYIQAKRWDYDKSVGREKIQAFQGALAGVGARKGVFMTTSSFTQQARTYVERLRDSKIVLIDGQQLAQLMIEHDVGVSIHDTFHLKRIDEDFFNDAEI
ncbi:restriction endonuclease [Nodosilinea sp. AN01ver1]|uniref:restriction endonuclease n=1 Tax=Nodosilinea sp. AN01ver1 TaxID=3423362 RepID=UPI003D3133D3